MGKSEEDIVSVENFLGTYKNGVERVEKYRRAMEPLDGGSSLQDIIFDLGISRKGLWKWRKEGTKPDALKGLETVQNRGWVPLDYSSEKFPPINRIAAWTLSGGSILPNFTVNLSGRVEDLKKIEKDVTKLGLKPTIRTGEGTRRGPTLSIEREGGSSFGRVVHCLGIPKGAKARQKYSFPGYLENAPENIKKDFLDVYLSNRMILLKGNRGFKISLQRHGEYREVASRFLRQLNRFIENAARGKGRISVRGVNVDLYFDTVEAKKVLECVDLRYNREKRLKAGEKLAI